MIEKNIHSNAGLTCLETAMTDLTTDERIELQRLIFMREQLRDKALAKRFNLPIHKMRNMIFAIRVRMRKTQVQEIS